MVFPAIDIAAGRFVRLVQGDATRATDFGSPLEAALALVAAGAPRLHLVDLDAAMSGGREGNGEVVAEIIASAGVPVQVGGGVRDAKRARELLDSGAWRVILGTAAVRRPELVAELSLEYPERIIVGLDYRRLGDGKLEVAVEGWMEGSGRLVDDVLGDMGGLPLGGVLVTAVERDGTLEGPDVEGIGQLLAWSEHGVLASGGVRSIADLKTLGGLRAGGKGVSGAIVGRALAEGRLQLADALALEGPAADGTALEGPAVEGPALEGPTLEGAAGGERGAERPAGGGPAAGEPARGTG